MSKASAAHRGLRDKASVRRRALLFEGCARQRYRLRLSLMAETRDIPTAIRGIATNYDLPISNWQWYLSESKIGRTMAQDIRIMEILRETKKLAQEYRGLTGKRLGITGEVAEYEAARILGLELTTTRQAGYDALEKNNGSIRRLQF